MIGKTESFSLKKESLRSVRLFFNTLGRMIDEDKKMVKEQEDRLGNAFNDLDAFMANLEDLEDVFAIVKNQLGNQTQQSEADKILEDLGCVDVITKNDVGNDYYNQLARQIDKIFKELLPKVGGAMSLIDVYLYYNRMRGADIITPSELDRVLMNLSSFNSSLEVLSFQGGLKIIQMKKYLSSIKA